MQGRCLGKALPPLHAQRKGPSWVMGVMLYAAGVLLQLLRCFASHHAIGFGGDALLLWLWWVDYVVWP